MSRESMSRPSASVPKAKRHEPPGCQMVGAVIESRNCSIGECGATTSAKTASSATMISTMRPSTAPLFSRKADQRARQALGAAIAGASNWTSAASAAMADPRVDHAVENVDAEVDQDDDGRHQHDTALQGRIVALADRLDQPMAD